MIIIGITGTLGAGKGTVVKHLTDSGFVHYSARAFIAKEVECKGFPVNRDTLTEAANELRRQHGSGYIIQSLYNEAVKNKQDAVIESIRTPGEIETLKQNPDFYLFAVDADPKIRYERIRKRGSETDKITFDKFLEDEAREMHSDEAHKQNIAEVMRHADYTFLNINSPEELFTAVDNALKQIRAKKKSL